MRLLLIVAAICLVQPVAAQVTSALPSAGSTPDLSSYPTTAQMNAAMAIVAATVPTAGTGSPTAIVDANSGAAGTAGVYAPFNHTHPSKARKGIVTTATDGTVTATFATAFPGGTVPICQAIAVPTVGTTDVINAQLDGAPTATQVAIRVTRTQRSVVALIGLTILSIPASAGATTVHYICLEP
jgi:hypothetical protein